MIEDVWSVPVRFSEVDRKTQVLNLSASEAQCRALAKWLDLPTVSLFEASVQISAWLDGMSLAAKWRAEFDQTCGITLETVPAQLSEAFEMRFLPADSPNAPEPSEDHLVDPDAPDPPDLIEEPAIDVISYLVEQFALNLDPFPRKPGAIFQPVEDEKITPFAVLANLKAKRQSDQGDG